MSITYVVLNPSSELVYEIAVSIYDPFLHAIEVLTLISTFVVLDLSLRLVYSIMVSTVVCFYI